MFGRKQLLLSRIDQLYVAQVPNRGRGLFCGRDIAEGEIIETCPSIVLDTEDTNRIRETLLKDYFFRPADMTDDFRLRHGWGARDSLGAMVLGAMSLCNHSRTPNVDYEMKEDRHSAYFIMKAFKDIPKDTELLIDYGDVWFAARRFAEVTGGKDES